MTKYLNVAQFINKDFTIVFCKLGDSIAKAKTQMLFNDFSQLPVLNKDGKIKGCISWKSIGKIESTSSNKELVDEFMEKAVILYEKDSFLDSIKMIAQNEYIFVANSDNKLLGIITTYDMTMYYNDFMFPYVKLGIIEDCLRNLITNKIQVKLNKDIARFLFWEYIELFNNEENWSKLGFKDLDKTIFINKLNEIRLIRNKVAHYTPTPLSTEEHFVIEAVAGILEKVCI